MCTYKFVNSESSELLEFVDLIINNLLLIVGNIMVRVRSVFLSMHAKSSRNDEGLFEEGKAVYLFAAPIFYSLILIPLLFFHHC